MLQLPWIIRSEPKTRCQGIKWSRVGIKHVHGMCGQPAEGIPDNARCSFLAKFHFTAISTDGSRATTGNYCWHHLMVQFQDNAEQERLYAYQNPS
jgi:hypothetical protein